MNKLSSVEYNSFRVTESFFMKPKMIYFILKQYKHFRSVIIFFAYMVNSLFRRKITSNNSLNDKSMFIDILFSHGKRMTWHKNPNMSIDRFYSSDKPRVILTRTVRKFFTFSAVGYPPKRRIIALQTAKLSFLGFPIIKRFFTCDTINSFTSFSPRSRFAHVCLLIKRTAFRYLLEIRLRISTLLAVIVRYRKTARPIDKLIITQG